MRLTACSSQLESHSRRQRNTLKGYKTMMKLTLEQQRIKTELQDNLQRLEDAKVRLQKLEENGIRSPQHKASVERGIAKAKALLSVL